MLRLMISEKIATYSITRKILIWQIKENCNIFSFYFQISLNEGAHQLRLYSQGPNGVDPLSESSLRDANIRIVPCASALVRLTRVPKGSTGKALEVSYYVFIIKTCL